MACHCHPALFIGKKMMNQNMLMQIFRFGIVGAIAAIVHIGIVVLLVKNQIFIPLVANIFGFFIAFQFSYWGHRIWTFNDETSLHRIAIPKLFVVQIINFAANESLFYIFLSFHFPYPIALMIVLMILPIFTFFSSKWWVFQEG